MKKNCLNDKKTKIITKKDFDDAIEIFNDWKKLDEKVRKLSDSRGINLPSTITEILVCYSFRLKLCLSGFAGDACDDNGIVYELKPVVVLKVRIHLVLQKNMMN